MPKPLPEERVITSNQGTRLLFLDGEKGSVACRVHGNLIAQPIPRLSPGKTWETSLRSRLRLNNLIAVRGVLGEGMIGPGDYYGNWEQPEKHSYSINIQNGFPFISQHPIQAALTRPGRPVRQDEMTEIKAHWISGTNKREIEEKKHEYKNLNAPAIGDSLFKNPGILEIAESEQIQLKRFDATEVDLSQFKARLIPNHEPFKITSDHIPSSDEWRAVSYQFDPKYAKRQVEHGGGLFLETHNFAQSMTPLDASAGGFVMLAKWKDETKKDTLELIAVRIPFGHTLIIEKGCIHGDTTLNGMYMMCMTSNHKTMSSADTVFLKQADTKQNIDISLEPKPQLSNAPLLDASQLAPKPLVLYRGQENFEDFRRRASQFGVMFNPLSAGWWKKNGNDVSHLSMYSSQALQSSKNYLATRITGFYSRNKSLIWASILSGGLFLIAYGIFKLVDKCLFTDNTDRFAKSVAPTNTRNIARMSGISLNINKPKMESVELDAIPLRAPATERVREANYEIPVVPRLACRI